MKLPRHQIAQTDLVTRHVEQFFPAEIPRPVGLATGVAIAGPMPRQWGVFSTGMTAVSRAPQSRQVVRSPFAMGARFWLPTQA